MPDHYLPGPAHMTRLDPVCARDSFGASPCALFRGRAGILRGSPCCLPRAIFTCIHICISHMYIYMYTHMYITHAYLHVYTYVYHTCIFTCIHICISHMYIYIHKHMYITHLAALSLSCPLQCPAALPVPSRSSSAEDTQDTHTSRPAKCRAALALFRVPSCFFNTQGYV